MKKFTFTIPGLPPITTAVLADRKRDVCSSDLPKPTAWTSPAIPRPRGSSTKLN